MSFSIEQGNRILDSLQAGGDWRGMFVIRNAQYENQRNYQADMDSLTVAQLAKCDSVVKFGFSQRRLDATAIQTLEEKRKKTPLKLGLAAALGIIIGLLIP